MVKHKVVGTSDSTDDAIQKVLEEYEKQGWEHYDTAPSESGGKTSSYKLFFRKNTYAHQPGCA